MSGAWKLVPVEPTEEMVKAGSTELGGWVAPAMHAADAYRAMLASAPQPPAEAGVAVRALRWPPRCPRGQRVYGRDTGFKGVEYCIAHYGGDAGDAIFRWAPPAGAWSEPCETYEAAKAAAQADYEARIRSVLVAPAATDLVREMLDALATALPYLETAESDPAYKPGAVARVTKKVRAVIAKADAALAKMAAPPAAPAPDPVREMAEVLERVEERARLMMTGRTSYLNAIIKDIEFVRAALARAQAAPPAACFVCGGDGTIPAIEGDRFAVGDVPCPNCAAPPAEEMRAEVERLRTANATMKAALERLSRWDDDTSRDFIPFPIRKQIDAALAAGESDGR